MKDHFYRYKVFVDPDMPYKKALMYEFIEHFMFGALDVEWHLSDEKEVVFFFKPNYEAMEQTIKEQNLEGLSVAEICQNHIDLFEAMLVHFEAIPDDMIDTLQNADITLELFAEYLANRLFEGESKNISAFDFKENYLKSI